MRANRYLLSVSFTACLVIVFLVWHWLAAPPAAVSFETARELRVFALARGLQTCNDGGNDGTIFFISDRRLSADDLLQVATRRDCGLTPSWRGIVWATQISTPTLFIDPTQGLGGHWRVWGNVMVAGDVQLMDRIEELYRNRYVARCRFPRTGVWRCVPFVSGRSLSGNSATTAGGGLYCAGRATVENSSSITGNTAPAGAGADVFNKGTLYLDSTTTIGVFNGNPAVPI
jgi:predicted outer membrane repeat protein